MAISREKKQSLLKSYVEELKSATNVVVLQQNAIGVWQSTKIRKGVRTAEWGFQVVKKRIFKLALKDAGYEDVDLDKLQGSVAILYANGEDEYAPLKAINTFKKEFDKDKEVNSSFVYLWAWFDKKWQEADYISELANIPSKDELLSKLAWLFNYPLQGFAGVLNQVAEKKAEWWDAVQAPVEDKKEEPKEEEKETVKEAVEEKVEAEAKTEEEKAE